MQLAEILLPIGLTAVGVFALVYQEKAGLLFCKTGKGIWRICTFGLTDMHWFYPEQKARRIGLQLGLISCLLGISFGAISFMSLSGPNSFAAMSQAQGFLEKTYGESKDDYSFTCHSIPGNANDVIVHYEYSGKTGDLHAVWNGKKYIFTRIGN